MIQVSENVQQQLLTKLFVFSNNIKSLNFNIKEICDQFIQQLLHVTCNLCNQALRVMTEHFSHFAKSCLVQIACNIYISHTISLANLNMSFIS